MDLILISIAILAVIVLLAFFGYFRSEKYHVKMLRQHRQRLRESKENISQFREELLDPSIYWGDKIKHIKPNRKD